MKLSTGYVYFVQAHSLKLVKIGYAADIIAKAAQVPLVLFLKRGWSALPGLESRMATPLFREDVEDSVHQCLLHAGPSLPPSPPLTPPLAFGSGAAGGGGSGFR